MNIEIDIDSSLADTLVVEWLKSQHHAAVGRLREPREVRDAIRTLAAIDVLLRYAMVADEYIEWANDTVS